MKKSVVVVLIIVVIGLVCLALSGCGEDKCPSCSGTGVCNMCNGSGEAILRMTDGSLVQEECPGCANGACSTCGGRGY